MNNMNFFIHFLLLLGLTQNLFSQNVGIGTPTSTRAKLELHGSVLSTSAIFGGESTGISLQSNWPGVGFNAYASNGFRYIADGYGAVKYLNPGNGYLSLVMLPLGIKDAVAGPQSTAMTISNIGNIGIRTNAPTASLHAIKAGNFDGSAIFGGTHYNTHFHYGVTEDTYIRAGKSGGNVYINDIQSAKIIIGSGTSLVGINTATPAYPLEIRQTGATGLILIEPAQTYNRWEHVVGLYNGGPESSLKLLYNDQLKCFFRPTDGAFITSSDRRLKTNIKPVSYVLNKIIQLRPVEYEMNGNKTDHSKNIGFIAQEVKKIFPGIVTTPTSESTNNLMKRDLHALSYNAFNVIAIKGVQEEQELIIALQNRHSEIIMLLEAIEKKMAIKN
ncbi:MAG TPA: tail fiber domain-containing protein [Ferruginibacter sp.]|nr:tail fiber domain-containing protein [Ferruginibacter sp.]